MTHKYSLAYLTVGGLEPSAQVYVAAQAGYDYVSLRLIPMGLPTEPRLDLAHDPGLLEACRAALEETGMKVFDIELARVMPGVDYETYVPALEVGAALGAKVLLSSTWCSNRQEQVDGLGRIAQLADSFGLKVMAEPVVLSAVKSVDEMCDLIREVAAPNLGVLIDVYHWTRAGSPLDSLVSLPPEWVPMIHLCDCPETAPATLEKLRQEVRESRLYVGEGDARIGDLVDALPDDVVFSIEQPNLARLRTLGDTEFATRSLKAAKATIDGEIEAYPQAAHPPVNSPARRRPNRTVNKLHRPKSSNRSSRRKTLRDIHNLRTDQQTT